MNEYPALVIVDDEKRVTQSLEREIRLEFGMEDFVIICFNNPLTALEYICDKRDQLFLVICDLRMPEMNGSEVLEKIRLSCPDVQTILLTAYTDLDNIQRAVSTTIQSLLFKPWTKESIVAEVRKALRIWKLGQENGLLKKRIDDMLRSAGDFQHLLFSQVIPESRNIDFSISFTPLDEFHCGGDFYDILDAKNGKYMVILGDVTGHGPKPAMIAVMIKTMLLPLTAADPTLLTAPDMLLKVLNDQLCTMLACSPETLIALSAVYLDPLGKILSIATAGLPPLVHIRNGSPELLRTPNHILGAFPGTLFYKTERILLPGDHIIFFTDGLTESVPAFSSISSDEYLQLFMHMEDYSASAIRETFRALIPGAAFTDDVTILSLTVRKETLP